MGVTARTQINLKQTLINKVNYKDNRLGRLGKAHLSLLPY